MVTKDPIPTSAPIPAFLAEPQAGAPAAPEVDPGFIREVADRIFGSKS